MISPDDPSIPASFEWLLAHIEAQGVKQWVEDKGAGPDLEGLTYLCKFAFFTGILTKAQIGDILKLDRKERKHLVKEWYDSHRARGCGTC